MNFAASHHYSYKYRLDIEKLPAVSTDKVPLRISACGLFSGLLFTALGLFEIVSYFLNLSDESYEFDVPQLMDADTMFRFRYSFDAFILIFGLVTVFLAVAAMIKRKTVFFDGEHVKITFRSPAGKEKTTTEDLYNYSGVLFRAEYYQFGLISSNRYIIELYHKDPEKCVPLYISTNGNGVRKMWEYYSAKLKMPALFITDHGLVSRNQQQLDITLKTMSARWIYDDDMYTEKNAPKSIKVSIKPDRVILRERRPYFDVYSVLYLAAVLILCAVMWYAVENYEVVLKYIGMRWFIAALAAGTAVSLFSLGGIFCKDVLIINRHDIILGHNLSFLRMDIDFIPKDDVESVDIGHNPLTDRYYITISSQDKNLIFGKNLPDEDLRYIRGCLIREIVK